MRRFKNILCVVNPHQKASAVVRRASELAKLQGTSLTLVHVNHELPATGEQRLAGEDGGVGDLVSQPLNGNPAEEIIKQVLRGNHDLLIKPVENPDHGATRPSNIDKFLLRQCPCPVWLFKPARHDQQERILAVLDPEWDGANANLNELVLDFSTSLGAGEKIELHAMSSWGVRGEEAMRSRVGLLPVRRLVAGIRRANMKWLRRITDPYGRRGARFHVHLNRGKSNDAILAEARSRRPDLIVMGTSGRVGIPEFLFGTPAERIVSQVDCSVLAVKPTGFVSTVTA